MASKATGESGIFKGYRSLTDNLLYLYNLDSKDWSVSVAPMATPAGSIPADVIEAFSGKSAPEKQEGDQNG